MSPPTPRSANRMVPSSATKRLPALRSLCLLVSNANGQFILQTHMYVSSLMKILQPLEHLFRDRFYLFLF